MEFEPVFIFFTIFLFSLSLSIGKRSSLEKNWGKEGVQSSVFYEYDVNSSSQCYSVSDVVQSNLDIDQDNLDNWSLSIAILNIERKELLGMGVLLVRFLYCVTKKKFIATNVETRKTVSNLNLNLSTKVVLVLTSLLNSLNFPATQDSSSSTTTIPPKNPEIEKFTKNNT